MADMTISIFYQTQKHYCQRHAAKVENNSGKHFPISLFANDMHIHGVLFGLQWLQEADIS